MIPWRQSVVARYVALSLLAAVAPLVLVGALYDRYSSDLLSRLTGERLERRLTVMSSRLSAFMAAQLYQLDTLAEYPFLGSLVDPLPGEIVDPGLKALVEFEANQPDLYGILLYAANGRMVRAVPGQAAAGSPYWGGGELPLEGLVRVRVDNTEIVGPVPGGEGRPPSVVLLRDLVRELSPAEGGRIALHLRLASLTERLGTEDEASIFQPLLLTPDGSVYSNIGTLMGRPVNLIEGPEILPGWRAALAVKEDWLARSLNFVRYALLAGVVIVVVMLIWLFLSLLNRIRHRVALLVDGAEAVASGNLAWRIGRRGGDEIDSLAHAFNTMAERLQQVIRSTVEVEKMAVLGRFATGVAHEVRNPLAALKTGVQVLLPGEPDTARRRILVGMGEEIDRLNDNVTDLLDFARPRDPRIEAVAIGELLQHLSELVERPARDTLVRISWRAEGGLVLRADAGHVRQILMNLILNALQAMPEGGRLHIEAARRNGEGVIEVLDSGAGMPEEVLPQITDPFFTTRPGGTGLGLAITRQLVEMNSGRIAFASRCGEGTIATVTLPLAS
jgi:two-component system sensor histidine kinase AtoS